MLTPAQHRTIAEQYDTRRTATGLVEPDEGEQRRAELHAILATKTGTGTHYQQADAILATNPDRYVILTAAEIHALLAE